MERITLSKGKESLVRVVYIHLNQLPMSVVTFRILDKPGTEQKSPVT